MTLNYIYSWIRQCR